MSLQGESMSLRHSPRLQSEMEVTMEMPGVDGLQKMQLRGYVVRIDTTGEKGHTVAGVVFYGLAW